MLEDCREELGEPSGEEWYPERAGAISTTFYQEILAHAGEGLFFLDNQLLIQPVHSRAVSRYLDCKAPAGKSLIELLQKLVSVDTLDRSKEYFRQLLSAEIDPQTIEETNPLVDYEFQYENEQGVWQASYFLTFRFRQICRKGNVIALAVSIRDVTHEVHLRKELEHGQLKAEKQLEWLVNILHVNGKTLKEFITGAEQELEHVNSLLKQPRANNQLRSLVERIYRSIYIIRGNAALTDLQFFVDHGQHVLDLLNDLQAKTHLTPHDFTPLLIRLKDLHSTLEDIKSIVGSIGQFHKRFRAKRAYESDLLLDSLKGLVKTVSEDLGKKVRLLHDDFAANLIPFSLRKDLKKVLFLLIRNVIYYGIETPENRRSVNRNPVATIQLATFIKNGLLGIVLRHDGRVLKIERLIEKMVLEAGNGLPGGENWEHADLSRLIFMPELSSAQRLEMVNGTSLDLDMLKKRVKEIGGRIKISFTSGEFIEITILLPLQRGRKKRDG